MSDDQTTSNQDQPTGKRSGWLTFSLRTLVVLLTISALVIAWLSSEMRKAKRESEIVERYCADSPIYCNIYFKHESGNPKGGSPLAPQWLRSFSSENLFSPIKVVVISSDDHFGFLEEEVDLSEVDFVSLGYCKTVKDFSALEKCTAIEILFIEYCGAEGVKFDSIGKLKTLQRIRTSEKGDRLIELLEVVKDLPKLKQIDIGNFDWQEEAVNIICSMKSLEVIDLRSPTPAPPDLSDQLRRKFLNAEIQFTPPK